MGIKNARINAGLTQAELAQKIGIGQPAVAMWECMKQNPSVDNLKKLSKILNCSIDDLLSEDNQNEMADS